MNYFGICVILSVTCLTLIERTQGADEADGLIKIFCNKDSSIPEKALACMAELPEKAINAQNECRMEAGGVQEDLLFRDKLCSGDRAVAEAMVNCVNKKRSDLLGELEDTEIRSALKTLVCLRKLGASLKKD